MNPKLLTLLKNLTVPFTIFDSSDWVSMGTDDLPVLIVSGRSSQPFIGRPGTIVCCRILGKFFYRRSNTVNLRNRNTGGLSKWQEWADRQLSF
jgi:hypothetical protein